MSGSPSASTTSSPVSGGLAGIFTNPQTAQLLGQVGQGFLQNNGRLVPIGGGFVVRDQQAGFRGALSSGLDEVLRQGQIARNLEQELERERRRNEFTLSRDREDREFRRSEAALNRRERRKMRVGQRDTMCRHCTARFMRARNCLKTTMFWLSG